MSNRITISDLYKNKQKSKIVVLTCYTAPIAKILDDHVDILLVGDSLGMTIYGHNNTLAVTKRMMIDHGKCVVDNSKNALVVVDLPFGSYETDKIRAFDTAAEIISKTNAAAIKLEGGKEISETVEFIVSRGIPVMGHIGLMPQKINLKGKFLSVGKNKIEEEKILDDAKSLSEAGVFSFVLEAMKSDLAKKITKNFDTISLGIGAGKDCDGQILVIDDLLGLFGDFTPKFVKKYSNLESVIDKSVKQFSKDVKDGKFPTKKYSY